MPALVDQVSHVLLSFPGVSGDGVVRSQHVGLWGPWGSVPLFSSHSSQDSGMIPAIASFETPHVSRISRKLPPSWAMMLVSGSPVLTRFPNGSVRSARTSGRVPTLLPTEADIRLAIVDSSSNLPTPVERRAWAC